MKDNKTEQGRSMIEMLGVLAIIGIIAVSALAGYSQVMLKFRMMQTTNQILTLSDDIAQTYSWMKTYPDGTNETLKNDGIDIPESPFGGSYAVNVSKNEQRIVIETCLPTQDVCDQLQAESSSWPNIKTSECNNSDGSCSDSYLFKVIFE